MKKYQIFFMCLWFLTACTISFDPSTVNHGVERYGNLTFAGDATYQFDNNPCIAPKHRISYQTSGKLSEEPETTSVLPLKPWSIEAEMPAFPSDSIPKTRKDWILGVFPEAENSWNVWILRSWSNDRTKGEFDSMGIFIYNTAKMQWTAVPAHVKDTQTWVGELFMTQDGTIWARNYYAGFVTAFEPPFSIGISQYEMPLSEDVPLFSVFNERENEFEFVTDALMTSEKVDNHRIKVLLDHNGVFWILVQGDGIYSYSPNNQKVEQQFDLNTGVLDRAIASVFVDSNNDIYFSDDTSAVFRFSSDSKQIEIIGGIPLPLEDRYHLSFHGILIDQSGRLRVGNVGWAEPDNFLTWYQLFPSPIFVTPSEGDLLYSLQHPRLITESVDGKLWYQFSGGLAWLNPDDEKWCWFTTERSNIVEDQQRNLWIVANHTLYRYSVQ